MFFQPGPANCILYRRVRDFEKLPYPRSKEFVERLWKECAAYVDPNAWARARDGMLPVFWEVYLAHSLRRLGVSLVEQVRTKRKRRGPDLRAQNPDVWIEAVAPTSGVGEDAMSEPPLGTACHVPVGDFVLRLRSAFEAKARIFGEYIRDGIVADTEPTVIAISGAILPTKFSEQSVPRIARALYGVGDQVLELDRSTRSIVGSYLDHRDVAHNIKGAPIRTDVFLNPAYAHISAVIYSCADWLNIPPEPGAEFMLLHNGIAKNPLPFGWLNAGTEFWLEGDSLRIEPHGDQE